MTNPGWYPDPQKEGKSRYFDGARWTGSISEEIVAVDAPAPEGHEPQSRVDNTSGGGGAKRWIAWGAGGIVVLFVIAGIFGDSSTDKSNSSAPAKTSSSTPSTTSSSTTTTPQISAAEESRQRVEAAVNDADGPVEDPKVQKVQFYPDGVTVTAATPQGGFDGPSTQDIDWQAQAIFTAVYNGTDFHNGATVILEGGLVDSATGKDLPHAHTGAYRMTPSQAKRIDWTNGDALDSIDWSLYRTFASPALKQS